MIIVRLENSSVPHPCRLSLSGLEALGAVTRTSSGVAAEAPRHPADLIKTNSRNDSDLLRDCQQY